MNIRDIARIANVTPGTVSKVLNNYPDISEATKKKVIDVINEYQYKPAFSTKAAQNFGKKPQIALILEGVNNTLYAQMEEHFSTRLHNGGYTTLTFHDNYFIQDKKEKFEELLQYIGDHSLAGIIYIGGNFESIEKNMFDKLSCPTIFVNTVLPETFEETNYSSVLCNNYESAYYQMDRLIKNGNKKIAMMISSKGDNSIYGLRYNGFKAALSGNKLDDQLANVIEGDYIYPKTYANLKAFLCKNPDTTAICCSADIMVPAILKVCHDLNKEPGKDIELISFDGLELMDYTVPTVSTFVQPREEMIDSTYNLLIGLIENTKKHQHIAFKCKLEIKESSK